MTPSGFRATAFRTADPDAKGPKRTGPFLTMLFATIARTSSDWLAPSPQVLTISATGVPAFMAATRSRAAASVRRVKTTPLMTAAGSWSFIPMQDVS